jgi:hypothetical protein
MYDPCNFQYFMRNLEVYYKSSGFRKPPLPTNHNDMQYPCLPIITTLHPPLTDSYNGVYPQLTSSYNDV